MDSQSNMASPCSLLDNIMQYKKTQLTQLAISEKANLRSKLSALRGRNQNGQPVEYGEPLFIIG
jgi:hypothetical protein